MDDPLAGLDPLREMSMFPIRLFHLTLILAAWMLSAPSAWAEQADFSALDRMLHAHVSPATVKGIKLNVVDYTAWAKDSDYPVAVDAIARFDTAKLANRNERLAFWINTYNLLAIKVVLDNRVSESIKDAGSFFSSVWVKPAGKVNGKTVTLDQIEHQILRPMGEPRVHMAIVCASLSCPDLRPEVYTADRLSEQLDEQARLFLANPTKGMAVRGTDLTVSKIFDWFDEDFAAQGGVIGFIRSHAQVPAGARIDDHFDYDWSLNRG